VSVGHYENFPVASLLMPARLRPAVRAIYRFARTADDIADEGDAPDHIRLQQLAELGDALHAIARDSDTAWPDVAAAVRQHRLPLALFHDLLSAFAQDVTTKRYADYAALLDYCRRSANPIGRLLLALYGRHEAHLLAQADAICTGLQLANFWQDVALDWDKGRVYLPGEDLSRFEIDEAQIAQGRVDARWSVLMRFETDRTRRLLASGAPLTAALSGRVGWELRLVIHGGLRILERIDVVNGDVFRQRPRLSARDWTVLGWRALQTPAALPA
jgi:squalene synthase HpnC